MAERAAAAEAVEVQHRGGARVWLRRLAVRDFRNLERIDLRPPADGIVIVGENGHGKTNLLEAIYYLQLLRSIRGHRDADLVRFNAPAFHLSAETVVITPRDAQTGTDEHAGSPREIGAGFERGSKRKRVRLDGVETPRLSDALGAVPSVMFSPSDVRLVTGSPTERRRYLDVMLALSSRRYLAALQSYRGALLRRNAALREAFRAGRGEGRIAVWEPALAEHGALLWRERAAWVQRWAAEFARLCERIGERRPARLRYVSALGGALGASAREPRSGEDALPALPEIRETLERALADKRQLDLRRGLTHAGPHRDDLELLLDGRELRLFGSAGQQRTAAIALRILEAVTLRDAVGAEPLFLLDDPFAELDARRAHRILTLLGEAGLGQTMLAVPRAVDIPAEFTRLERWTIRDGVLSRDAADGGARHDATDATELAP
jgi:DNA replication and repair protein RecF